MIPLFLGPALWADFENAEHVFHSRSFTKPRDLLLANSLGVCELRLRASHGSCELMLRALLVVLLLYASHTSVWWDLPGLRVDDLNLVWISDWWSLMYNTSTQVQVLIYMDIGNCIVFNCETGLYDGATLVEDRNTSSGVHLKDHSS